MVSGVKDLMYRLEDPVAVADMDLEVVNAEINSLCNEVESLPVVARSQPCLRR